ncbi:MAG: hypothetical protein ABI353_17155 [Isosphaeraceae bacterium]
MGKKFTVSDGKLVLDLWPAEEGGYTVTSPLDPALITEAETLEEAFAMAYDAQQCLGESRSRLASQIPEAAPQSKEQAPDASKTVAQPSPASSSTVPPIKPPKRSMIFDK